MRSVGLLAATAVLAVLAATVVHLVLGLVGRLRWRRTIGLLRATCRWPFTATVVAGSLLVASAHVGLPAAVQDPVERFLVVATLCAGAWLVIRTAFVAEDLTFGRLDVDVPDNRRARRRRTQVRLLRRLTAALVICVAGGSVLLSLPGFEGAGASLIASAGLLSVVAGLAAQTTLGNVFAGLQLAFTDALRLGDVIVIEDEWGRVEEITLTYVVLALWDERRLVLPTSWFTTHPFQNWTRTESRVLGEVLLHLDYAVPVEQLRLEAQRVVAASPLWDRRDWVLQVVDTTPSTMVVRVLASSADAPSAYDLRCEIREKLLGWVQAEHSQGLPHLRVTSAGAEPYNPFPTARDVDVTEDGQGRSTFTP